MSYFVAISRPDDERRELLESAKGTVTILKSQYRLRALRAQKREHIKQLGEMISDITGMFDKLVEDMPNHGQDAMPDSVKDMLEAKKEAEAEAQNQAKKKATIKKAVKKAVKSTSTPTRKKGQVKPKKAVRSEPETPKELSEEEKAHQALTKLESKLSDIESKLNKL